MFNDKTVPTDLVTQLRKYTYLDEINMISKLEIANKQKFGKEKNPK